MTSNRGGESLYCIYHYSQISDESITVAFEQTQTVKQCLWSPVSYCVKQRGIDGWSSPGWRVWTACFGLCVSWLATLCSRHATTGPRKRRSMSTDGDLKPEPLLLCLCLTFEQMVNLFFWCFHFTRRVAFYLRASATVTESGVLLLFSLLLLNKKHIQLLPKGFLLE